MKFRPAGIITKIVILALALYAGISLITTKARIAEAETVKQGLENEIADVAQSNAELKYEIEHSQDDATIEDIARNKLGLVMPGEKIFYDIAN